MPDASVLVAGGGAPGPQNNTNMEIYYPPYLYNAAGGFATRPVHRSRRRRLIDIGETFGVQTGRHRRRQPRRAHQDGIRHRTAGTWSSASSS